MPSSRARSWQRARSGPSPTSVRRASVPRVASSKASTIHGVRFTGRKLLTCTALGGPPASRVGVEALGEKRSRSTKFGMTRIAHGVRSTQNCSRVRRARDSDTAVTASAAPRTCSVSGA